MNTTPRTIVVLDDDDETVIFLCDFVTMLGMEVVPCHSDTQAVATIADHCPIVIIVDFWLQDMTGVDVLQQLRADPTTQAIPVVFFTGSASDLRKQLPDYAAHGAYLVVKPNVEQLSALVQRLVQ